MLRNTAPGPGAHASPMERELAADMFETARGGANSDWAAAVEVAGILGTMSPDTVLRAARGKCLTYSALTQRQSAAATRATPPPFTHRRALRVNADANEMVLDLVARHPTMLSATIADEVALRSHYVMSDRHARRVRLRENTRKRVLPTKAEASLWAQIGHAQELRDMAVVGDMVIYVDETHKKPATGFGLYGYTPPGQSCRVQIAGPLGLSFSTLAAMSSHGMLAWKPTQRAATGDGQDTESFLSDFAEIVMPLIQPYPGRHSVVVLDRCPCAARVPSRVRNSPCSVASTLSHEPPCVQAA